ncbi:MULTISPECIES: hypothetical protein [unclassified Halobacteriovorax]|uniref:hypothetical protein n=1 Tax=unclassified Halobacteriovorax TaxID=2639665 RepID=UPI00399B65E8
MRKFILLGTLVLMTLTSCTQPTNSRANYNNSNGNSWDNGNSGSGGNGGWDWGNGGSDSDDSGNNEQTDSGDGYGDGNEEGTADGDGQTTNFYTVGTIVLRGSSRVSSGSNVMWSSTSLGNGQAMLYTDSRFNIRVRPRTAPTQGTTDAYGEKCHYNPQQYKKLRIKLCIRAQGESCESNMIRSVTFGDIANEEVSKVKEFSSYSLPTTTGPIIVDVLDVQWDWSCQFYLNQGYSQSSAEVNGYCPMARVWDNDCVGFDLQFSTDYTKDFPASAPRM